MPTGQGDVQNPNAWTGNSPTLGTGSLAPKPPQGDFLASGYTKPGDPNNATALTSFAVNTPTLATGSLPAVTGKGDVGDVLGSTKSTDIGKGVYGLIAWDVTAPTMSLLGSLPIITGKGDVGDVGNHSTLPGIPNDTADGPSALIAWAVNTPTLGVGAHAAPHGQGDIMMQSPGGDGILPVFVWVSGAPTLGLGTIAPITGKGDIMNPYSWEDAVFYLTSQIYPVDVMEHFITSAAMIHVPTYQEPTEHVAASALLTAGTLQSALVVYSNWPAEHIQAAQALPTAGTLVLGLVVYSNWPAEHIQAAQALPTAGTLTVGLIVYSNWPAEHIQASALITGGTLA